MTTKDESKKHAHAAHDAGGIDDNFRADGLAPTVMRNAGIVGAVGLLAAVGLGAAANDGFERFFHSYLVAFMFALAIALGALFWVTLQHLVNAHWSVVLRRIGELLASGLPLLAVLALPIVVPALLGNAALFPWVDPAVLHSNHAMEIKAPYFALGFFAARCLLYFGFWSALAWFWLSRSKQQDTSADPNLPKRLGSVAAPAMIVFALTLTFAAIDFIMTLDPMWYSTIFGVYYFAGCVISVNSTLALTLMFLQSRGVLKRSVTVHHFHDIGKLMFAFTVFWAYVAFSQFMLIWYANIPEETVWYAHRVHGSWLHLTVALGVGHFALPFFGLISRHVKRNRTGLAFWAIWLLVFEYIDLYWLIMPNYSPHGVPFAVIDVAALVGVVGLFIAFVAWRARGTNLVPIKDPRLPKSLAFENI
jgi:hypothetical protein